MNNYEYRLISDANHTLSKHYDAFSVPFFADRVTVVLDPWGKWVLTYAVGDTKQHPHDVLADLELLLGD